MKTRTTLVLTIGVTCNCDSMFTVVIGLLEYQNIVAYSLPKLSNSQHTNT